MATISPVQTIEEATQGIDRTTGNQVWRQNDAASRAKFKYATLYQYTFPKAHPLTTGQMSAFIEARVFPIRSQPWVVVRFASTTKTADGRNGFSGYLFHDQLELLSTTIPIIAKKMEEVREELKSDYMKYEHDSDVPVPFHAAARKRTSTEARQEKTEDK